MKKNLLAVLSAVLVLAMTAFLSSIITYNFALGDFKDRTEDISIQSERYKKIGDILGLIERNYIGEYDESDLIDGAAYGMLTALDDRWSHYLNAEAFNRFNNTVEGQHAGIGAEATMDESGNIKLLEISSGTPAEKAGLIVYDVITAVDGELVTDLGYQTAVRKVQGEAGTEVVLTIVRAGSGETFDVTVRRDLIDTVSINYQMLDDGIGYIKIKSFSAKTASEFQHAIAAMENQGVKAYIFDVRNNPGGTLTSLQSMLDALLPEGKIITLKGNDGTEESLSSDDYEIDVPMVALINEYSISAAEFFAAALSEYDKAVLVGVRTTGKGYSQETFPLGDGTGILLSTNEYFTPKGNNLANIGVAPDIEVILTEEQENMYYELTPDTDPQILAGVGELKKKLS